jgi:hypothetical protein
MQAETDSSGFEHAACVSRTVKRPAMTLHVAVFLRLFKSLHAPAQPPAYFQGE